MKNAIRAIRHVAAPLIAGSLMAASAPALAQDSPPPPKLEFAFEEVVTLGQAIPVGKTPLGTRNIIPITGGTFEGPGIKGTIIPGGWDWQLQRSDGCTHIKADYMLRTDDGVVINVINAGALCPPGEGSAPPRTQAVFEAPEGKYGWLNRTAVIGTLELAADAPGPAVRIRFYKAM